MPRSQNGSALLLLPHSAVGSPSSPKVMLSPNATKLVSVRRGACWTTMLNVQRSVRWRESVAVHVTGVVPTGNGVLVAGVQLSVTGGEPPVTVAVPYATVAGWPFGDVTGGGAAGHEIRGASGVGSPGAVGGFELPQPGNMMASVAATATIRNRRSRA